MPNFIIKLALNSLAVLIASYFLSWGVHIASPGYIIILIALTLSMLNISVKPLLIIFTLPVTILSLGLFLLVINTIIIKIAAYLLDPYFRVDSWWAAFLFSILLSILNSLLERVQKMPKPTISKENDVKIYDKDGNRIA